MKKIIFATLALAFALTSCVKDEVYVAPPTPEVNDSPLKGKLVLNEINGTPAAADKYVEFFNLTGADIDLGGCKLYYGNAADPAPSLTWTGAPGTTLAAGGYLVLTGANSTPSGDMSRGLSSTQAIVVDFRDASDLRIDLFQKPVSAGNQTFARIPNGTGGWYYDAPAGTKGASNGTTTTGKTPIVAVPEIDDMDREPAQPTPDDDVVISAMVTASDDAPLATVVLTWTLNTVAQTPITMTASGDTYSATILKQADGAVVAYTITATDTQGGVATASDSYTVTAPAPPTAFDGLVLNEINPLDTYKSIELYNAGSSPINLNGVRIFKNYDSPASGTAWWACDVSTMLPAGGFLTIGQKDQTGSKDNSTNVDLTTGNSGISDKQNLRMRLYVPDAANAGQYLLIDEFVRGVSYTSDAGATTGLGIAIPTSSTTKSYQRCPDGSIHWRLADPTPKTNNKPLADASVARIPEFKPFARGFTGLVINEVNTMTGYKCFEFYNSSDAAMTITGAKIVKDESTGALYWANPNPINLPAGGFYTVGRNTTDTDDANADEKTATGGISGGSALKLDLYVPDAMNTGQFILIDAYQRSGAISTNNSNPCGRYKDGTDAWVICTPSATKSMANIPTDATTPVPMDTNVPFLP